MMSHDVPSHPRMSHDILITVWCMMLWYHMMSHDFLLCTDDILWCHVMSHDVKWCPMTFYEVPWRHMTGKKNSRQNWRRNLLVQISLFLVQTSILFLQFKKKYWYRFNYFWYTAQVGIDSIFSVSRVIMIMRHREWLLISLFVRSKRWLLLEIIIVHMQW